MRTTTVSYLLAVCLLLTACNGGGSGTSSVSSGSGNGAGGDAGAGVSGGTGTGGTGTGDTPGTSTPDTSGPSVDGSGTDSSGNTVVPVENVAVRPGVNARATDDFSGAASESGFALVLVATTNSTSLQMLTTTSGGALASLAFTDPSGTVLLDATENTPPRTYGLAFDTLVNSLPYPTRSADTALTNGVYKQTLGFIQGQSAFSGTVVAKNDLDLNRGVLRATVFLVGDEAQRTRTRTALDSAVAIWQNVYSRLGSGVGGVTVQVAYKNVSSNTGIVPNPTVGSQLFQQETSAGDILAYSVPVFVGYDISADGTSIPGNSAGLLGVSSGIPGPALPTQKSAVAISIVNHAGSDGVFSDSDVSLLGETLAHEVGHYLGLVHPVECRDRTCVAFTEGDALSDTGTCSNTPSCIANSVASNLMFPVPVAGQSQRSVTTEQGGVVNLQVLVD